MNEYLEEAARLLRKAAEENEKYNGPASRLPDQSGLIKGRERIAMKFAELGAIEAGVVPPEMVAALVAAAVRQAREEASP